MKNLKIDDVKNISIVEYLHSRGLNSIKRGKYYYFLSPFSHERTPSFCVYPTNTFYDWSNGVWGDVVQLVKELENISTYEAIKHLIEGGFEELDPSSLIVEDEPKEKFNINKFITNDPRECSLINKYAFSRSIISGYERCVFYVKGDSGFIRRPAVGFIHTDENGGICGVKMRDISPYKGRRFSARGKQMYYILRSGKREAQSVYIVESESSANSLYQFFKIIKHDAYVVSFGSCSTIPNDLPKSISGLDKRHVIIDYDGNGDLYKERIDKFSHLNASEIKLELPKGEDINSLFRIGKLYSYKNLLI